MSRPGSTDVPLHPLVAPVGFLLGAWEGQGRGLWTSDSAFFYLEHSEFTHNGGPFIAYRQRTSTVDGSRPLHGESGYLRPGADHSIEMVVAQPTGIVEALTGSFADGRCDLLSSVVSRAPTAINVTAVARTFQVDGSVLTYRLDLAMNDEALAPHLEARLERVE